MNQTPRQCSDTKPHAGHDWQRPLAPAHNAWHTCEGVASCGCESADCTHPMYGVPAGSRRAMYVGPVCDDCADSHMAAYLVTA